VRRTIVIFVADSWCRSNLLADKPDFKPWYKQHYPYLYRGLWAIVNDGSGLLRTGLRSQLGVRQYTTQLL
jgi:hypothetical protein